jgi:hypothetical protein
MELSRQGREYFHFPVSGLADGEIPNVKVGSSSWQPMEEATDYEPPADAVVVGATWWRVLLAGPSATSNPAGTIVVTVPSQLLYRFTSNPEVLITHGQWVTLTD